MGPRPPPRRRWTPASSRRGLRFRRDSDPAPARGRISALRLVARADEDILGADHESQALHTFDLVGRCGAASVLRADAVLVLKAVSVAPGAEVTVKLLWTNPGGRPLLLYPPHTLAGRLHAGTAQSEDVQLVAGDAPDQLTVAPGAFAQVDYSFRLPPEIVGPAVLEVKALGAQPVMFSVQEPEMSAAAGEPSNRARQEAASQAAHETALRRSTRLLPGIEAYEPVYFGLGGERRIQRQVPAQLQIPSVRSVAVLPRLHPDVTLGPPFQLIPISRHGIPPGDILPQRSCLDFRRWSPALRLAGGPRARVQRPRGFRLARHQHGLSSARDWNGGSATGVRLAVSPKIYGYLEKSDNPDIADYRGYADLQIGLLSDDWRFTALVRKGTAGTKGSIQVDAVLPSARDRRTPRPGGRERRQRLFFRAVFRRLGRDDPRL